MGTALMAGAAAGFLYCLPVSSVNVEILRRGLAGGFRRAFAVSMGAMLGDLVWFLLAVLGAELLAAHGAARAAVGFGGAAVLFWIAWLAWRSARRLGDFGAAAPAATLWRDAMVGALMCVSNPFAVLVLLSLMQSLGGGHLAGGGTGRTAFYAGLLLGPVVFGLIISGAVAWGRRFVTPRRLQYVDYAAAIIMLGLGIVLAWHATDALRRA